MNSKKENLLDERRKKMKVNLSDPATLKDLPHNPDQRLDKKKILYGDYIKKAKIL